MNDLMAQVQVVTRQYGALQWTDRIRVLFGCGFHERIPVAFAIDEDGQIDCRVSTESALTVDRFFSDAPALPAQTLA